MADVATKTKTTSVVSTNNTINGKTNPKDVCSVQSNNGLTIDNLDNGHNNGFTHNNKLVDLCDDDEDETDLVKSNNTKNELDSQGDKSLQELIESELALRISANSADDTDEDEPIEDMVAPQPEITKKIILEPMQESPDINAEFILNEIEHYAQYIGQPYEFSNGHVSPDPKDPRDIEDEDDDVFEIQTETTATEPTTTSGPSLPSAYEVSTELESKDGKIEADRQNQEEDQTNTLSDLIVTEETDDDSSKELSHLSVVPSDKFIQEEEITMPSSEKNDTQNDIQDDIEEDSSRFNDEVKEDSSCATFIEHEFLDSQGNVEEPISLKEASGVDEKTCSFYSTEAKSPDIADNDESLSISNNPISSDVTDFKNESEKDNGWITVGDIVKNSGIDIVTQNDESIQEKTNNDTSDNFYSQESKFENYLEKSKLEDDSSDLAPLATPDEISEISNAGSNESESREEVITTSSVVSSTKKKKKIEGTTGSDASTNHTKTKKTKKSKKSELEKENISVTQTYSLETHRAETERPNKEIIATGVSIKQLCRSFGDVSNMNDSERIPSLANSDSNRFQEKSSFNKFDALTKKSPVLHVRSVDAAKVQQQLNSVSQNGDANPNCRSCGKVVFQMEQTKAEGLTWHKNCFRCCQCSKQLNVDNYESHEATLYCRPHFKELFQPKPVEENDQPTSDKPDLGLEELSSLNVKSRFQVFEKGNNDSMTNDIERSPSQVAVKRSPSILSKLAKFQAKGMDIGVTDDALNGIPYEESSESEEEIEEEETEEVETETTTIIKSKRGNRERPISFTKMDDMKNRWENTSRDGRRESQREARKEEIAGIRSRLFMGKQGKMKEMYQQAVADSEKIQKINAAEEIQHSTNARTIKERFERGEPIAATSDEEIENAKNKSEKPDEEILAAGISRKSRSLFLELDATAAKVGRPVTPNSQVKAPDTPRRARDAFMGRQVSDDVVRSSDQTEEIQVETSDISNKFRFFESYREPEKTRKQFRITPPRDGQVKMDSPDREIYRDPEVVRADDRASDVVHTDTARKMLSIFRQMEEKATKEELPDGPKPLKRFTPPPEDKFVKATASESDEDEEEAEESEDEEHNPNYVRASDKVEDEFLKQAKTAARAKTLRAKFEHWETTDVKTSNHHVAEMDIAQTDGSQPSIESASSLRARFESLGSPAPETPRTPKVKVNRFVEIQTNCMDVCESCEKKVYPLEKVETNNKIFHKQCFRCLQCNCILRMDTFTLNNGKLYCIPHFKQLFITRGNYDEGFGVDPHKNKWATVQQSTPITVSNGDV